MEEFTIKFQDGTVKDNGVNGLQVEEALLQCIKRISELNAKVPCPENCYAMEAIHRAIQELEVRTKDREERGVEGTYEL